MDILEGGARKLLGKLAYFALVLKIQKFSDLCQSQSLDVLENSTHIELILTRLSQRSSVKFLKSIKSEDYRTQHRLDVCDFYLEVLLYCH